MVLSNMPKLQEYDLNDDTCVLSNQDGTPVLRYQIGKFLSYCQPYYSHRNKWYTIRQGRLFRDRLIVHMDERETITRGGIIIPDKSRRRPMTGVVILHGIGVFKTDEGQDFDMAAEITPGDRILFRPVAGMPIYWGTTQEIWHFRAGSILAKLEGEYRPDLGVGVVWSGNEELEYEEDVV